MKRSTNNSFISTLEWGPGAKPLVSIDQESIRNSVDFIPLVIQLILPVYIRIYIYIYLSNFKSAALRGSLEVGTMMVFKGYEAQVRGCEVQVRWCSEDSAVVR